MATSVLAPIVRHQEAHLCLTCWSALNAWDSSKDWWGLKTANMNMENTVAEGCCFCSAVFTASELQSEQLRKIDDSGDKESYLFYNKFPSDPPGHLIFQIRLERAGGYWPVWCQFTLVPITSRQSSSTRLLENLICQ
jgi:hypothetical protein